MRWLIEKEWARSAEDVLWRRTKLGLRFGPDEVARLQGFMAEACFGGVARVRLPEAR